MGCYLCGYACMGICAGSCTGSCNANCASDCAGSCSGGCSGGCTSCSGCNGSCRGRCNAGCANGALTDVYNRLTTLGLHEFIEKDNIQDIIDLVNFELQRRSKTGTIDSLSKELIIIKDYFNHIQENLQTLGYSQSYVNETNNCILRNMGLELINQVLNSYSQVVGLP